MGEAVQEKIHHEDTKTRRTTGSLFRFDVSPLRVLLGIAMVGFGICGGLVVLWRILIHREYAEVSGLLASAVMVWVGARRLMKPLPSTICCEGSDFVIEDMPRFWIWLNDFSIPLIVHPSVRIPIKECTFEWIGRVLTWNDIQKGRSIPLAAGIEAQDLAAWLLAHGACPPSGVQEGFFA